MPDSKFHNFNFDSKIYKKLSKNSYKKRKYLILAILIIKIIKFCVKIFHLIKNI